MGRKKITIDVDRVIELRNQGLTLGAIANRFGVSTTTVLRRLEASDYDSVSEDVVEASDHSVSAILGGVKVFAEGSLFIEEVEVGQTSLSSECHISIDRIENGVLRGVRITR